jgi:hypothetical protein
MLRTRVSDTLQMQEAKLILRTNKISKKKITAYSSKCVKVQRVAGQWRRVNNDGVCHPTYGKDGVFMFRSVPLHEDVSGNGGVAPQILKLGIVFGWQ